MFIASAVDAITMDAKTSSGAFIAASVESFGAIDYLNHR